MSMLVATGVGVRHRRRWIFRDLGVRIEPGEVVAVVGPPGSGRTTALLALAGRLRLAAGKIEISAANEKLRARLADVRAASDSKNVTLVDIRSADEYSGKIFAPPGSQELTVRAGHVPNALNVPWSRAVAEDGTFKSPEELKKLYADAGIDGKKPIIVYCRIGERSSHTWFLLSKILGYDVKNYDGSWTEYGNSVGLPVVNVAGTVWGGK